MHNRECKVPYKWELSLGTKGTEATVPMDLRSPWERALKQAGIEDYRFYDNRHSCASYLLAQKATLAEIAEILGHKTLQMVKTICTYIRSPCKPCC